MSGKRVLRNTKLRKTANTILLVLSVFLLSFIVCMIVLFCKYQAVPDTLIQCVLDTSKYEALALAAIKIAKVMSKKNSNEEVQHEPEDS